MTRDTEDPLELPAPLCLVHNFAAPLAYGPRRVGRVPVAPGLISPARASLFE